MIRRLTRKFFTQPTLVVAKDLLGKFLVRRLGKKIISGKIVETEAYIGPKDRASHAFGGKLTARNKAEYLIGGHIYIYLVYGMYWQMNITTAQANQPECVLIRALEPTIQNKKSKIKDKKYELKIKKPASGPGKLCQWLKLDKSFYGEDLVKSKRIWLENRGVKIKKSDIIASKRIGIDYAGKYWANKKWRFYIKDNLFVSKQ